MEPGNATDPRHWDETGLALPVQLAAPGADQVRVADPPAVITLGFTDILGPIGLSPQAGIITPPATPLGDRALKLKTFEGVTSPVMAPAVIQAAETAKNPNIITAKKILYLTQFIR